MRKPFIAGNWKMNKTPSQAEELLAQLLPLLQGASAEVAVCPPAVCLPAAAKALRGTGVALGAQNVHWEEKGAFTGEIAADMLLELGVTYVIIGHSERRQFFGETDQTVNRRALFALQKGLVPIICVGETRLEREAGRAEEVVAAQTVQALSGVTAAEVEKLVIAYEPVWAIGTGLTATKEDANALCGFIRERVREFYGAAADSLRIQYGGSMNAKNAAELMAMPEIDGGLIGGASLTLDFAQVVNYDKQ